MFRLSQVPFEICLCLFERRFIGTGIDRKEKVSFFHILPLCEMDAYQFSSHLRLDRNRRIGLNIPDGTELYRDCFLDHRAHDNRDRGRNRLS